MPVVFLLTFLYHATSPVSQQGDSRWTVPAAMSLVREGNLDLNEYGPQLERFGFYAVECVKSGQRRYPIRSLEECAAGKMYAFYPAAVTVLAAPAIVAQTAVLAVLQPVLRPAAARVEHRVLKGYLEGDFVAGSAIFEIVAASLFAALAAALMFGTAREWANRKGAAVAAVLFACGTPMLSTGSRALWQHAICAALLSGLLLLLSRWEKRPALAGWMGPVAALAFFVRPTAAIPAALAGCLLLGRDRRAAARALVGALPVVAAFAGLSMAMYGTPLAPYFHPVRSGSTSLALHGEYGEALVGVLVSPGRGLLVYVPFLVLLPWSWRLGEPRWRRLARWVAAMLVGHWLLICLHTDWWGGHSFGPRYFTEVMPLALFLMLPAIGWAVKEGGAMRVALAVFGAAAILIHFRGSHAVATHLWNVTPVNVNAERQRLWDWRDPQFLR